MEKNPIMTERNATVSYSVCVCICARISSNCSYYYGEQYVSGKMWSGKLLETSLLRFLDKNVLDGKVI